jgi:hypothetical protein
MKLKALSVVSPNGMRIAKEYKTIEVRSWTPTIEIGETFLIVENDHFLKTNDEFDNNGRAVAFARIESIQPYLPEDIPSACATVWCKDYFSWKLKDIRPIFYSQPVIAQKGFYSIELDDSKINYLPRIAPQFNEYFLQERFLELLKRNEYIQEILNRSISLGIPNWAIGAGFLQQTIYNLLHGRPVLDGIRDIDWVYFEDSDLSENTEINVVHRVCEVMKDIPLPFDIKNQARVHLWYKKKFGYEIKPYASLEDAIATWPTTATAIALTKTGEAINLIAPFGLSDLMNMQVQANKRQITEEIYLSKIQRWKKEWPRLSIIPW